MKNLVIVLLVAVALAGCAATAQPAVPPPASPNPPTVVRFEASPTTIRSGESTTLQWEITNAASASIDQNIGPIALKGNMSVAPTTTTTYTITAMNKNGTSTQMAQVIISGSVPPPPPDTFHLPVVTLLTVQPANIVSGATAVLSWEVQNSFDVSISPGFSIIPVKGSREVSPAFTTTYKLTTGNSSGTIIASTTLTVSGTPPSDETPIVSYFTAVPYVIPLGQSATLQWKTSGGSSVTIDNGVGIVDGTGSKQVTPSQTTTYLLTVINPRGAQFQSTTVNVR